MSRVGRATLAMTVLAVGVAGFVAGMATAPSAQAPLPTTVVAAIPTSTPDKRPALPAPPEPTPRSVPETPRPTPTPTLTPIDPALNPGLRTPTPATIPFATPRPTPTALRWSTSPPTPVPGASAEPRGRGVVFFAAEGKQPAAVIAPAAIGAHSQADRIYRRLSALPLTRAGAPQGYVNVTPRMRARLAGVSIDSEGVVVVRYSVPGGDWGVSVAELGLLLQQIVFTATEEPGIDGVRLTQNSFSAPAVIAGTVLDGELTRDAFR